MFTQRFSSSYVVTATASILRCAMKVAEMEATNVMILSCASTPIVDSDEKSLLPRLALRA